MNRHFEDSRYYLKRAVQPARKGVREEGAPVGTRVRALLGREREPEPGRVETVRSKVKTVSKRARGGVVEVVTDARETVEAYRGGRARSE
jgi:hypothetical protein